MWRMLRSATGATVALPTPSPTHEAAQWFRMGLLFFVLVLSDSRHLKQSEETALSRKERDILSAELGNRMSLFVGHIPDVENVGVFTPVKVPGKFAEYDQHPQDGYISPVELTTVTGAIEGARSVFLSADLNKDGRLSVLEFIRAPWWLRPEAVNAKARNAIALPKPQSQPASSKRPVSGAGGASRASYSRYLDKSLRDPWDVLVASPRGESPGSLLPLAAGGASRAASHMSGGAARAASYMSWRTDRMRQREFVLPPRKKTSNQL